jgi:hypothetical protein
VKLAGLPNGHFISGLYHSKLSFKTDETRPVWKICTLHLVICLLAYVFALLNGRIKNGNGKMTTMAVTTM